MRPKIPDMDLVFAVSATSSESDQTFRQMKEILKSTVDNYGSSKIRYGIITFGDTVKKELDLARRLATDGPLKEIMDLIPKPTGRPALVLALKEAERMFQSSAAERPGAKKVLVVLMDIKSVNTEEELKNAPLPLKELRVRIIAVPVGGAADSMELQKLTASSKDVIPVKKSDNPSKTTEDVMERIRDGKVVLILQNGLL